MITASLRAVPGFIALAGAVVLVVSVAWARYDELHPLEMRVFRAVNRMPDWLYVPLWLPMQYGNFTVGLLGGVAVGLALGEPAIAVAVVLAAFAKLAVERGIRQRMAGFAAVRQRPGTSEPGAITRGDDVPKQGASFPSGHVILAAAISTVLSSALDPGWASVPWVLTALVMVGRVYVGAHNPLDVTAGLGAGMIVGGVLDMLLR
ncbi:MAG TPA: phosphatase PAP2 family protein [Acidimicrobiales bacterium]|jgi:undecaprenyl-diphosphatase